MNSPQCDQTSALITRPRGGVGGSSDRIALSMGACSAEEQGVNADHIRPRWAGADFILGPSRLLGVGNTDFNRLYESFTCAVEILTFGYVWALRGDRKEAIWRPLKSAAGNITTVDANTRSGARTRHVLRPRATKAGMSTRREWHRAWTEGPNLSLAALIEIVSQRYSFWRAPLDLQQSSATQSWGNQR